MGASASAAKAFCQNAMSVAGRSAAKRRFSTASSAKVKPDSSPQARPCTLRLAHENSGTSSSRPASTSPAVAPSVRRHRRPSSRRSSTSTNSGKLANPSSPIATLATWIAAKNDTQCSASVAPAATSRRSKRGDSLAAQRAQRGQRGGGHDRPAEDDDHRRQVQPLAEQAREAEQQHGAVQGEDGAVALHRQGSTGIGSERNASGS